MCAMTVISHGRDLSSGDGPSKSSIVKAVFDYGVGVECLALPICRAATFTSHTSLNCTSISKTNLRVVMQSRVNSHH